MREEKTPFCQVKPVQQDHIVKTASLPSGTLQTEGTLLDSEFPDDSGFHYQIDFTNEMILFKNKFSSDSAQLQYYKQYINVHTRLYYLDYSDTGCVYGFERVCGLRLIELVRLDKE
jgi:hypothetical protein